jgi:hypothetical protein
MESRLRFANMQLFVSSMLSKLSEAARGVKSQLRTSSVITMS